MNKPKLKSILRKRRTKRPLSPEVKSARTKKFSNAMILGGSGSSATQKKDLKFAGPIKIIVVDPKSEYCKTVWCAICMSMTNVAIGAVNMTVFLYSLSTGDIHAIVCCVAYHFFSAEAITALHFANGWSAPMRSRHRTFAHIFLHFCGFACAIAGTVIVILSKGISTLPHGLTGVITGILFIFPALVGPCALYKGKKKPWLTTLHMAFGIPAFIMSSICLCFGIILEPFSTWAGGVVPLIVIVLVVFYTVVITISAFLNCVSRLES